MHWSGKGKPRGMLDAGRPHPLDHTWKSYDLYIAGDGSSALSAWYATGDHVGVYSQKSVDTVDQAEMLLGLSRIQFSPYTQTTKMKLNPTCWSDKEHSQDARSDTPCILNGRILYKIYWILVA